MSENPEDQASRVRDFIFAGNKIGAIKVYREQTGLGLKESKEAVEKLEAELRASSPDRFTKTQSKGCTTVPLAVIIILGMLYSFLS